jgi:hypothetical protein
MIFIKYSNSSLEAWLKVRKSGGGFECPCRVKVQYVSSVHRHVRRCKVCREFALRSGEAVVNVNNSESPPKNNQEEKKRALKIKKKQVLVDYSNDCQGK